MQMVDGYIAEHGEDGTITFYYDDELKEIEEQKRLRQEKEKLERERLDFEQFRWGFTIATVFSFFLVFATATWNITIGAFLFASIFWYIPAIIYVHLSDDSIRYKKLREKMLHISVLKITFLIEIVTIVLILILPATVLLFPILSYFLSRKIFEIAVLKRYDLFIDVFKDGFYKLRIGILILSIIILFLYSD